MIRVFFGASVGDLPTIHDAVLGCCWLQPSLLISFWRTLVDCGLTNFLLCASAVLGVCCST
jgi:hypothetical protein